MAKVEIPRTKGEVTSRVFEFDVDEFWKSVEIYKAEKEKKKNERIVRKKQRDFLYRAKRRLIYKPEPMSLKSTRYQLKSVFYGMRKRCYNPKFHGYHRYGGRGIRICDEWLNDFNVFYDWATANGYKYGLTIHRVNNDGNYCPENCVWVTLSENVKAAYGKTT